MQDKSLISIHCSSVIGVLNDGLMEMRDCAVKAVGGPYCSSTGGLSGRTGLSVPEPAEVLKVSRVTVMRDWSTAKGWLYRELTRRDNSGS